MIEDIRQAGRDSRTVLLACLCIYLAVGVLCFAAVAYDSLVPAGVSAALPSAASTPYDPIVETDRVATSRVRL